MKTHNNHFFKLPVLAAILFFYGACNNENPPPGSNKSRPEHTENDTKGIRAKMSPINLIVVEDLMQNFSWLYKHEINNAFAAPSLSISGDSFYKVFENAIPASERNTSDTGIVFYHVVVQETATAAPYFSFAYTPADRREGYRAAQSRTGKYYLIKSNGNIETLPKSVIDTYRQKYWTEVVVRGLSGNQPVNLSSVIDTVPECFYSARDLERFRLDNGYISTNPNMRIDFIHGAMHRQIGSGSTLGNYKLHTPVLVLRKGVMPLLNNSVNFSKPYENKALDIGRLCPPECGGAK